MNYLYWNEQNAITIVKNDQIIFRNSRATVDVNRDRNEATQCCTNAEVVYDNYHNKIEDIIASGIPEKTFLVDFHGQVDHFWRVSVVVVVGIGFEKKGLNCEVKYK